MDSNEYQKAAARTHIDGKDFSFREPAEIMMIWDAMGLAGEAGEVANLIKKGIFHRHGVNLDKVIDELGDVLWYAAGLCTTLGLDLEEIMHHNVEKLKERYPEGFSYDASKNRKEGNG